MKILIVNQTFYPDLVATAQHAGDLAAQLAADGHEVSVITSRRGYDNPDLNFPTEETWRGVHIKRIFTPGFGKQSKWRRLGDFGSFLAGCVWRLLGTPKPDVIISLTSPPLIAFLAALFTRIKGAKLLYWVMDLNPDQALAAGILQPQQFSARVLEWMLRYALMASSRIIVLDRFMWQRIRSRGVDPSVISTLPPWSHDDRVAFDQQRRDRFRRDHAIEKKFVVMYAGNHSACHPLDTLVSAAEHLASDPSIVFCFVGGGPEHQKIAVRAADKGLTNVICLPKQPDFDPLFAADLHVVVMGDPYIGIVHPCKVYNILALGTPLLYIGPLESHVTDLAGEGEQDGWFYPAQHGAVKQVAEHILRAKSTAKLSVSKEKSIAAAFSQNLLLGRMTEEIRGLAFRTHSTEALHAATAESEI